MTDFGASDGAAFAEVTVDMTAATVCWPESVLGDMELAHHPGVLLPNLRPRVGRLSVDLEHLELGLVHVVLT